MDYKTIFTALLIGHFLGDFYFQSDAMANEKDKDIKVMCGHGLLYLLAVGITAGPFLLCFNASPSEWLPIALIPVCHFIVDLIKRRWPGWGRLLKENQKAVLMVDQALHILIAAVVAYNCATTILVAYSAVGVRLQDIYAKLNLGLPAHKFVRLICLFLFMGKPANIFIQKIIFGDEGGENNKNVKDNEAEKEQKAGRLIGIFERYLAVILVILQQYSALAFVLTAKSIARFDKISKEPKFAERYLLGTLSSVLSAVAGAVLYLYIP